MLLKDNYWDAILIEIRDLRKVFENGFEALKKVNFTIEEGELICLLGPSGCGKTTILNLIAGLLDPTSGDILNNGESMINKHPKDRHIGFVFQNYALYPHMTVLENVMFPLTVGDNKVPKKEAAETARKFMKLTSIEELENKKPSTMSGGQQQRVAITRALVQNPSILLLDEPLSNLDARLRLRIREEIRRLVKEVNITTIFVTHDQEEGETVSTEPVTIEFWHAMNFEQENALTKITEDFMADHDHITVELMKQSSYPDLQAKINSTLVSPDDLPTITQAYPGWLYTAAQDGQLVDLGPYMDRIDDLEDVVPALVEGAKIEGVQYGIPFNKSTEVLYYNADILEEYGVEVPTTMEELKEASQKIYEESDGEIVGVGCDSLNNYYSIGMANQGIEFDNNIDITGEESVEVMKFYQDGIRDGYFRIAGEDRYLSGPFGAGVIAMNIGSMAGEAYVRDGAEGNFEYGVAVRPGEMNIQQGTDIYMFSSASQEEIDAAITYLNYIISADAQLYWAIQSGYMPVRTSVQESDEYKSSETKTAPILADATENLFSLPVINNADAAYNMAREFTEKILADPNSDVEAVLEEYQPLLEQTWNQ